jgi:hypothetical protein
MLVGKFDMNRSLALALIAIIVASGCVGQSGGGVTNVESQDVIIANNEPTIPASPVAGTVFTARFTVKNQHEERTAKDVSVTIFDVGKCTLNTINGEDAGKVVQGEGAARTWPGLMIQATGGLKHVTDFAPGQTEVIRLDLTAPTREQMQGLRSECPIRYRISYGFDAVSEVTVQAISADRIAAVEAETGARPSFARTLNIGAGPIRVFIEPKSQLPVESGQPLRLEMQIKNEGAGEFNKIEPNELILTLDPAWVAELNNGFACNSFYVTKDANSEPTGTYLNEQAINLVQKQSNVIRCAWTAPSVALEKQYVIQTKLPYSYEYFGQPITVPISP